VREVADGGQRAPHLVAALRGQDHVGEPGVERRPLGVQAVEAIAVARQRPARAAALPRRLGVDVEQHHGVASQPRAHALGGDRAAAEREHRRGRRLEQLADGLLLLLAERALAVRPEVVLDRAPQPPLEQVVGVDGLDAHGRARGARRQRLAGAHEADEDQRAGV
jgi:hypothetical protein